MKVLIGLIAVLLVAAPAFGQTYNRCSLARAMHNLGVRKSHLPQWTCIAERESTYRTHVVGPPNSDGSRDYGIFQINDKYWCQPSNGKHSYNGCNIDCDDLLSTNIRNSVDCALHVKSKSGWKAWTTWKYCNGDLPSIDDCF